MTYGKLNSILAPAPMDDDFHLDSGLKMCQLTINLFIFAKTAKSGNP
jgi:hypothetical protein